MIVIYTSSRPLCSFHHNKFRPVDPNEPASSDTTSFFKVGTLMGRSYFLM